LKAQELFRAWPFQVQVVSKVGKDRTFVALVQEDYGRSSRNILLIFCPLVQMESIASIGSQADLSNVVFS
jgi:hypothetical protein